MKTKSKEFRLPASFYRTALLNDSCREVERKVKLGILQDEVRALRRGRHMDTVRLFLERVKTPVGTFVLGFVTAIALLYVSGCATTGGGSLVVKDGVVYVCFDTSPEDRCYKVVGEEAKTEDIEALE